jgi:hypothetical protein
MKTMIYLDIAKPQIQEQVAKLNKILILSPPAKSNLTSRLPEDQKHGIDPSLQPYPISLHQ